MGLVCVTCGRALVTFLRLVRSDPYKAHCEALPCFDASHIFIVTLPFTWTTPSTVIFLSLPEHSRSRSLVVHIFGNVTAFAITSSHSKYLHGNNRNNASRRPPHTSLAGRWWLWRYLSNIDRPHRWPWRGTRHHLHLGRIMAILVLSLRPIVLLHSPQEEATAGRRNQPRRPWNWTQS
jgi:hypothetical protein